MIINAILIRLFKTTWADSPVLPEKPIRVDDWEAIGCLLGHEFLSSSNYRKHWK